MDPIVISQKLKQIATTIIVNQRSSVHFGHQLILTDDSHSTLSSLNTPNSISMCNTEFIYLLEKNIGVLGQESDRTNERT